MDETEMAQFLSKLESRRSPAGFMLRRPSQEIHSFRFVIFDHLLDSVVVEVTILYLLVHRSEGGAGARGLY
jgi:hypothetical protein